MENPEKNAERIELQKMSNANFIFKFLCVVHRFCLGLKNIIYCYIPLGERLSFQFKTD